MVLSPSDFKRPPQDNGRGIHLAAAPGWSGGDEGLGYWIDELQALGIKWVLVRDDNGSSLPLCRQLVASEIFPVVRLLRRDPPPTDSPEPNPGHLNAAEEQTVLRLVDAGVLYFETNSEPDVGAQWKNGAIPADPEEAAKLVALNWLFDARVILDAGAYPALPAVSSGGRMDLIGALVSLGRQDILLEGCWMAIHNYALNRPLDYPEDPTNQKGALILPRDYDLGPLTQWAWWDLKLGRPHSLDEMNQGRAAGKNPGETILQDHACFRGYEYFYSLAQKHLGRPIPILSTEGGVLVGRRADARYPRITPQMQADLTTAMFDFIQRQAPDYYFACMPWLLLPSPGVEQDSWYGDFWARAFESGPPGTLDLPPFAAPEAGFGPELPVIAAVKSMSNVSRETLAPPAAVSPPVATAVGTRYTVERGDTLASIARKFRTNVTAIVRANRIADPSGITEGEQLTIPPAGDMPPPPPRPPAPPPVITETRYTVQPGDTLLALAHRFDTTISAIVMANGLTDPNRISVGQLLIIPVPKPATSARTFSTPPPPPTARRQGAAPPAPRPAGIAQFDPRLGALGVHVSNAIVVPGLTFWKLVGAVYLDAVESVGRASIFYTLLDEQGAAVAEQRILQGSRDATIPVVTDASGNASYPIEESYFPERGDTGPYSCWVDGLPSDRVTGLGRPHGQQVSFRLTWQRVKR